MTPSTVLFVAANPVGLNQLDLGEECRAIDQAIGGGPKRDQIRLEARWAARPRDLIPAINRHAPRVLHFCGHGAGEDGLCFQTDGGDAAPVTADGIAQVMQSAGSKIVLVVLNACYSEVQAQAIAAHVPCVVGMPHAVGDHAAIVYAAALYSALAFGLSVDVAHRQGIAALALEPAAGSPRDVGPRETLIQAAPVLLTRPGSSAADVYLAPGTTPAVAEARAARPHSTVTIADGDPSFVGRELELRAIEDLLRDRPVVVLHGAPGLGKTRLAMEYARSHRAEYPGGTFFAPLDKPPPADLTTLLRVAGQPVYADETPDERARRALYALGSGQRALLIYDAVADESTLRTWLPCTGLAWHLIATSTSSSWAARWATVAVRPLSKRWARSLVSAILVQDEPILIDRIVAHAGGITSELCATAATEYARVQRGRSAASTSMALSNQTTTRFEAAWKLLSVDAQRALRVVSELWPARASTETIALTLQRIGWSAQRVDTAIDEVLDRSLATADTESVVVHELLARFACSRASLVTPIRTASRHAPRLWWRRWLPSALGAAGAMAALALALQPEHPSQHAPPAVLTVIGPSVFESLQSRPSEIRLSFAPVAKYRPIRDRVRGLGYGGSLSVSYVAMARFQLLGDGYALAIARWLNGEDSQGVLRELRRYPQTLAVRGDIAAIQVDAESEGDLDPVLAELETLGKCNDHAVASAARWNHTIALSRLGLSFDAATELRQIAGEDEAGWAEEAQVLAADQDRRGRTDLAVRVPPTRATPLPQVSGPLKRAIGELKQRLRVARSAGQWGLSAELLAALAVLEERDGAPALARAYRHESDSIRALLAP